MAWNNKNLFFSQIKPHRMFLTDNLQLSQAPRLLPPLFLPRTLCLWPAGGDRVEKTMARRSFHVSLELVLITSVHTPLVDLRLMATPNTGMWEVWPTGWAPPQGSSNAPENNRFMVLALLPINCLPVLGNTRPPAWAAAWSHGQECGLWGQTHWV